MALRTNSSANGLRVTNNTGSSIYLNANTGSPGNPYMYFTDGTVTTALDQRTNGSFVIGTYGGPYQIEMEPSASAAGIYIQADGDVSIGNSSPIAKLDVEGGIRTSYSGSTIITLAPNANNTITHNLGITGNQLIVALNGDTGANLYTVAGINQASITTNSFAFYAVSGVAIPARVNWVIFIY